MGTRIVQVDLAQPLPTLQTAADRRHAGALWILVKLGPQPVGWVRCLDPIKQFGDRIGPDQLLKLTNDALSRSIQAAARDHAHAPIVPARTPTFSIVICTRAGDGGGTTTAALERQLESIAKLNYRGYEVIVVDGGSGGTALRAACEKFAFARCARDPRPSINYARNTGWQLARSEVVAYLAAGAIPDTDWMTALAANYDDAQVDCVTGLTLPREIDTPVQAQLELHRAAQRKLRRRVERPGTWSTTFPLDASRFTGGSDSDVNFSISRQTLETMDGFDVALGGGAGAFDLFARVLRDGGSVAHDPRAIVFETYPQTSRELRQHRFDAGRAFTSFCAKHAHDLEFANHAIPMLARWFKQRLAAAVARERHLPLDMLVAELLGGVAGLRGYRRAVRKAHTDQARFARQNLAATEIPLRAGTSIPAVTAPAGGSARKAAAA